MRRDEGSMLVELVVGMVLMSLIGTVILRGIIGGFSAQRQLQDRGQALEETRRAAQRITRDIREGIPVPSAQRTQLTVVRDTATGTLMRTWQLSTTNGVTSLVQTSVVTVTATGTSTTDTKTVISDLDPTVDPFVYTPTVSYVSPVASVDASTCAVAYTVPTEYSTGCIGKVELRLTRKVAGHTPVSVKTTVELRNAS